MNVIAVICMIAAGTALPLMDVVFGQFVNVFNDFAAGNLSPAGYRDQVAHYAYVVPLPCDTFQLSLTFCRLFFIYLFIGKFFLTYIWTVRTVLWCLF
jgi:ATP-binding cassette subfamily B (MDR/TAP) protein 1